MKEKMEVKFNCYFHTAETSALKAQGRDWNIRDCNLSEVTFYNIDNISPHYEDGLSLTEIRSGSGYYIATCNFEEAEQIIREARLKENLFYLKNN